MAAAKPSFKLQCSADSTDPVELAQVDWALASSPANASQPCFETVVRFVGSVKPVHVSRMVRYRIDFKDFLGMPCAFV